MHRDAAANDAPSRVGVFMEGATLTGRPEPSWTISTLYRSYDPGPRGAKALFGVRIFFNNLAANVAAALRLVRRSPPAGSATPIDLFGYSRGAVGVIAVARRLEEAGRPVRFLGLIDPVTRDLPLTPGWFATARLAHRAAPPANVRAWWIGLKGAAGLPWYDPLVFPTCRAWAALTAKPPFGGRVFDRPCDLGRVPDHNQMAWDSHVRAGLVAAAVAAGAPLAPGQPGAAVV
jgi:hypothetical protein